jgi:hypothetical protein
MPRFGITMTGLTLVSCGGAALCLGLGVAGPERPDRPVLDATVSGFVAGHPWFWPTVAGAGVSLALIGLLWLLALTRTAVARRFTLAGRATRELARTAIPELADDVMAVPGVRDVRARLIGPATRLRCVVSVVCDESADLAPLRARLEQSARPLRVQLGLPELPLIIRFRLVYPEQRLA